MSNSDFTNSKYPHPDGLSTEALREILRSDLDIKDEDTDSEYQDYIFRVMEILELREKSSEEDSLKQIETAWNHFLAENPEVSSQHLLSEQNAKHKKEACSNSNQKNIRRLSLSRILISSTLTVLLFATATASAFDFNIFSIIGRWTKDIFHLGATAEVRVEEGSHEDYLISNEFVEMLNQAGIPDTVIPSWFPPSFYFTATDKQIFKNRTIFFATLSSEDSSNLAITITQYTILPDNLLTDYEKSDLSVEKYEKEGVVHYILQNFDIITISWLSEKFEISITGDITKKEAYKIINSIYKEK